MSLVFAVRRTGDWKLLAAAGCTSICTTIASGSVTCSVIVAGILSEFLRTVSVQRPTTKSPWSEAVSENVRVTGVPPSEGGGLSSGAITAAPAPGAAAESIEGATGLREQPVRKTARVVRRTAESREPCRIACLAECRVLGGGPSVSGTFTVHLGQTR